MCMQFNKLLYNLIFFCVPLTRIGIGMIDVKNAGIIRIRIPIYMYTVDSNLFELAVIRSSRLFEAIFISLGKPSLR